MSEQILCAWNVTRGCVLASRVRKAQGILGRIRGLIGQPPLKPEEGLLLTPCSGIHTLFMRYPIDVVFLDKNGRVVATVTSLKPWRATPLYLDATSVLEVPAGTVTTTSTQKGDRVELRVVE